MKRTLIYYVLIIVSLVTICYSYSQRKSYEEKLWAFSSNLLETRFALTDLKEKQSVALSTNGTIILDSLKHKLPLRTLILRLHNGICLSCYAENLLMLKTEIDKRTEELFVLGSYTFDRGLKDEIAMFQDEKLKSINVPALRIMPADSLDLPYVFCVNERGQIENLHFFVKKDFSPTLDYLKSIERLGWLLPLSK